MNPYFRMDQRQIRDSKRVLATGPRNFIYEDNSTSAVLMRKAKAGTLGFLMGSTIGAAAYTMHMRRITPKAIGPGAFMGVIIAVGSMIRSP